MDRYFSCSFFTTFFLREKESGGKKSAYKGDCAAIRYAPIRRSFPLIYPPDDCSANSESICLYPKRSSGTTTPVSKRKVSRHHLSLSESENSYTRIYCTIIQLIFSKGCVPHNGKPYFRSAIISVTLPEKDSLLSKFSPGLFQKAASPTVPTVLRRLSALFYKIILTVEMRCDIMECIL